MKWNRLKPSFNRLVALPISMGNLKIKYKLNLAFGVLISVTFVVMGVNYWSGRQATLNINRTQELRMPIALSSSEAQTNLLKMLSNVRGYLITGDSVFRQGYQESRHQFERNLLQMEQLFQEWNVPIQLEQLQTLQSLYDIWLELPPHLFELKDNRLDSQPAFQIWENQAKVVSLETLAAIDKMIEEEEQISSITNTDKLKKMLNFQTSFSLLVADLQTYITTQETEYRFNYTAHSRQSQEILAALMSQLEQLTESQQEALIKIIQNHDKIKELSVEMFALVGSDRYREDLYIYQTQVEPIAEQMLVILTYTVESQQNQLTSELKTGVSRLYSAQIQTLIGACFTLGLGIIMTIVLRQKIADPIQRLTEVTSEVKAGNLQIQAQVESGDEIGILAETFNQMTDSLKQSLYTLEEYTKNLENTVENRTEELQVKNNELQETLYNLKEAQTHLIQAEKMSGLGQMVAGIAHEINNPVTFIHSNLVPLMEYCQDLFDLIDIALEKQTEHPQFVEKTESIDLDYLKEDLPKIIEAMNIGTVRIREIIASLRNFSRLDESELKIADIHEGLESTLLILQHRLKTAAKNGHEIELKREYQELPLVECYPGQLNQVFMNIIANGIEVLEENDDIGYDNNGDRPTLTIQTQHIKDSSKIVIQISDNGPGIKEETIKSIFDPFFTTKPVGKGTGLGLSISYKIIVEHHQGVLQCHSQPGQGATFYMEIPVHHRTKNEEITES